MCASAPYAESESETAPTFVPAILKTTRTMETKVHQSAMDKGSNLFLTGAILFANLDYHGLEEYALKAAIGGVIWMVFKVAGDFIHHKIKSR